MVVAPLDRLKVHRQIHGISLQHAVSNFGFLRTYWRGALVHFTGTSLGVGTRLWAVPLLQLNLGVARTRDRSPTWNGSVYAKLVLSRWDLSRMKIETISIFNKILCINSLSCK